MNREEGFTEKREELFDEDFIDFSGDRETLIETNLSEEYEETYDTFDEDADNTDFTEENIEEIFSPSEFIHKEKSEHNRELHEEDYPAQEVEISLTEDYNNIDEASSHIDDDNHIPDEHIEEVNIKDHLKIDMACDMLEEEMIISDSLWETEEETIDLSFNDNDIIELKENIPETPGTASKHIRPSENITEEKSDYIQDNAKKYFEEAQKLIGEEHFEQAVRLCEKALDYNDEFLEVHYTLGTIYKKINRSDLAVESYKKYLALKQKKSTEKISKKK